MELDPKYASVIVQRYAELVGSSESITVERNGETLSFTELADLAIGNQE